MTDFQLYSGGVVVKNVETGNRYINMPGMVGACFYLSGDGFGVKQKKSCNPAEYVL